MNSFNFYLIIIVCCIVACALLVQMLRDFLFIKRFRSKDLNMSYPKLVAMRMRGVNPKVIFDSSVRCQSHGIPFQIDQLEFVCLSGGNLEKLTDAMIHSKNQGKLLTWDDVMKTNDDDYSDQEIHTDEVVKKSFCENEQTSILSHYVDGCLKKVEHLYPNGQKKIETILPKGRKYVFLYKDGKLLEAEVWMEGGQKCTETNLINGNGTVRFFDEDGSVLINYKNGERLPASLLTIFKLMFRKSLLGKLIGCR